MTDFIATATRLIERGYSVIPIMPGEKRPGEYKGEQWVGMSQWQRYCDRSPTKFEMDMWAKWPKPSICMALGRASNITAIDYDYGSEELRAELVALLPPSPCRKMGAKGFTDFYRGFKHTSKKYICNGVVVVELLAHGKQTVLPPSLHPEGMNYRWLTDKTMENTSVGELPEIPLDYHDKVAEVISKYQTQPIQNIERKRHYVSDPNDSNGVQSTNGYDSYWNDINQTAISNLEKWIPKLFPDAIPGAGGGYRVNPDWRGITKKTHKLSINSKGIVDFGTGEGLSAIDLVMKATGGDLDVAVDWLKDALGIVIKTVFQPDLEPTQSDLAVVDVVPQVTDQQVAAQAANAQPKQPWRRTAVKASPLVPLMGGIPPAMGALGKLCDHINATSIRSQPILALGAAICALGTLAGRKYRSPTDLRTNIYLVSLADSGAGKDHARTVIDRLFADILGCGGRLGGDKIASGAGLLSAVTRNPAILFQLDEFGAFLQAIANRYKAPPHLIEILNNLTQLFTTSNKTFRGTEYANQRERPRQEIIQPCVSVYGTTVPSNFWKALETNSAVDGSLARFLVLETDVNYPDDKIPSQQVVPLDLIDLLSRICNPLSGSNMGGYGTLIPDLLTVGYSPAAASELRVIGSVTLDKLRKFEGTPYTGFWARRQEHTIKVAMIHAIGRNPEDPIIDLDDVAFGLAITDRSIKLMIQGVERFVSDNNAENLAKRVVEVVRKSKNAEITKSALYARTLFLGRDRENTLKALEESGLLYKEIIQTTGRPKMVYRLSESQQ